jgi:ribose transport system substrate-binding protein
VKTLPRVLIVFFGFLALGALLRSFILIQQLKVDNPEADSDPLNYHFSLYLPDNRNSFFTGIIRGAGQAALEMKVAISIHSIDPAKFELEMASYTGIDGVIVCPYMDDNLARRQLEKLGANRIPAVIINHNVPHDQPWPFIGTNNFDVGRRIGLLAGRLSDEPVLPAVVYSDKSPGFYGERELVEMGITAALGSRLGAPILGLRTNLNPLDAEELLYRLFRNGTFDAANPGGAVNTIIFTDSNDTIAAAQTLVDMNLVGRIQVIGFGADAAIEENIRKGVIACSIFINGERIGYEAIRSLVALKHTGYTSASINPEIQIITRESLR